MGLREAHEWWLALSAETKSRLMEDPDGPVPGELIAEVTGEGAVVVGAWFPAVQTGPDGFFLPREYRDEVRGAALLRAWTSADEAYESETARYFVVADYPLSEGMREPELTFDDEAAQRLNELREAAVKAQEEYEQFVWSRMR